MKKAPLNTFITALIVIFLVTNLASATEWRIYKNNLQHTGVATDALEPPLELFWRFKTKGPIVSSPVVYEGTLYFGSSDYYFYAIDSLTGEIKWKFKTNSRIDASPAVWENTVYVGSLDGNLYALDAKTGKLKWKFGALGSIVSSPVVEYGLVLFGSTGGFVYGLNATTGEKEWAFKTGGKIETSPAVYGQLLIVGSYDGKVYALGAKSGAPIWTFDAGEPITSNSVVVDSGTVYVIAGAKYLYVLDVMSGKVKWKRELGRKDYVSASDSLNRFEAISSSATDISVVGGAIYSYYYYERWKLYLFATDYSKLYHKYYLASFDTQNGQTKWQFEVGGPIKNAPTISGSTVYFGSDDGYLYAVHADSGELKWKYLINSSIRSSPVIANGILYVGADDGYLYAFASNETASTYSKLTSLRKLISKLRNDGVHLPEEVDNILSNAEHLLRIGELDRTKSEIGRVEDIISKARYDYTKELLNGVKETYATLESKGFDVTTVKTLIVQAEKELNAGNYDNATELINQANGELQNIKSSEAERAQTLLNEVKLELKNVEDIANVSEFEGSLLRAQEKIKNEEYPSAITLLEEIRQKIEIIKEANNTILSAEAIISQKKEEGFNTTEAENLLEKARELFGAGDYENAKKFAETAQALAVKAYYDKLYTEVQVRAEKNEDVGKAKDLLQQAKSSYDAGDYTKALEILKQVDLALQEVQPSKNNTPYILLGLVILGAFTGGVAYIRKSGTKREALKAEFDAMIKAGDSIAEKDQFGALEYYSKALALAREIGDPGLIKIAQGRFVPLRGTVLAEIESLLKRGDEALLKSDYDRALAYYRQALNFAEKLGDGGEVRKVEEKIESFGKIRKIRELLSEGDVLMEGEKYSEAASKYEEALRVAKEIGDKSLVEMARERLSKANENLNEISSKVSTLVSRATQAMAEGHYGEAVEDLSEALALAERTGGTVSVEEIRSKLEEAKTRGEIARLVGEARKEKEHGKAMELYSKALELAEKLGDSALVSSLEAEIDDRRKQWRLEILRDGIDIVLPRELPYNREVSMGINVINKLDETIEGLTVDLSDMSAYFSMDSEKIEFPPIRPGRSLGKDIKLIPQFKGDFEFNIGISSSIGETAKTLRIKVGDYYSPETLTPRPTSPKAAPEELEALYEDFQYIGEGGFARVFKAKRKKDGRIVAVKIPKTLDPATGKAFVREISNWLHLNHPNIVRLYDVNVIPIPYLEMEFCESSVAKLGKPMDIEKAAYIVFNIAEGLKYAHSKGIIHRDLKPSNVLLKNGVPKISDWGLSKVLSESRSSTLSSFTPFYASPEQLSPSRFGGTDHRSDIWQLGVLFYELVTGKLPFDGRDLGEVTFAIINDEPVPPGNLNPEAKVVEPIIMKMLAKRKEERYQSIGELQKDLARVLNMTYTEGLRKSTDLKRTVFYIGDLALINLKAGDLKEALKYFIELREYAGKYGKDLDILIDQIKLAVEEGVKLGEEAVMEADIVVHQIKMGR